jgi:hypothetical protein
MTVHELSQLVLEWIWARPKPLHKRIGFVLETLVVGNSLRRDVELGLDNSQQ